MRGSHARESPHIKPPESVRLGAVMSRASKEMPVVVVGGGAAGLYAAIRAAETGTPVVLVSRKPLQESSSYWAQGGLAAALSADDSPERHAADTLAAGRGLCRLEAVEILVQASPGGGRVARSKWRAL